jgi:hypothetical protein
MSILIKNDFVRTTSGAFIGLRVRWSSATPSAIRMRRRNTDGEPWHARWPYHIAHAFCSQHWAGPVIERATPRHHSLTPCISGCIMRWFCSAWATATRPGGPCTHAQQSAVDRLFEWRDRATALWTRQRAAEHLRVIRPISSKPPRRALRLGVYAIVDSIAPPLPARRECSRHASEERAPRQHLVRHGDVTQGAIHGSREEPGAGGRCAMQSAPYAQMCGAQGAESAATRTSVDGRPRGIPVIVSPLEDRQTRARLIGHWSVCRSRGLPSCASHV